MSSTPWMEECVYRLLPASLAEKESRKPPRYVSQFRPLVRCEMQERRWAPCKTMGPPKLQVPSPKHFLQKHSKAARMSPQRKRHRASKKQKEPYVPRKIEPPVLGVQSKKNFIAANAAEAIMSVPKKPVRACVDERHGDKFLIEDSGKVKKYVHKKDFGAVPRYLAKHNQDVQTAQEEADARVQEVVRQKRPKRISRDEREALLEGLKQNWEEINREFQGLSVVTDTIPKRLHKEKLEVEMKQLEHDIKAIEKHCFIYVAQE